MDNITAGDLTEYVKSVTGEETLKEDEAQEKMPDAIDTTELLKDVKGRADGLYIRLNDLYTVSHKKQYYDALVYLESIVTLLN